MNLTPANFNALTPPDTKIKRIAVDNYSNLYIECQQRGVTIQYKFKSPVTRKHRFVKIARFNYEEKITKTELDQVINQLTIIRGDLAREKDPLATKEKARAVVKKEREDKIKHITLSVAYREYTKRRDFTKLADSTQICYELIYKHHIRPALGHLDIQKINPIAVQDLLDSLGNSMANTALTILKRVEEYLLMGKKIDTPFLYLIKRRQVGTCDDYIKEEDLPDFMDFLNNPAIFPTFRNVLHTQLLYGNRIGEVLTATWDEIDMKNKVWVIPPEHIKTQRGYRPADVIPHALPILPAFSKILLEQRYFGTEGRIFNSYIKDGRVQLTSASLISILHRHGFDFGTHALRRTVATVLSEQPGINEYDIKIILNHKAEGVTARYLNSKQLDRKREILKLWHSILQKALGKAQKEKALLYP